MKNIILVTGGAGYVGNTLVRFLLDRGYRVRILDRLIFTDKHLGEIKNKIELIKGDIRNISPDILEDVKDIIHLAAYSSEPTAQCNPREIDLVNHIATENLAKMAKEKGVERFIFASSCSVYFTYNSLANPEPSKETDSINPISIYALTKRAAEQALLELSDDKFHPIILRKGTVYGFSPRMRYELVLNSFTKDIFLGNQLTINAGGQIWRPLIDIKDAVWAYTKALEMPLPQVSGKIFNVCSKNLMVGDLATQIKNIIKEKKGVDVNLNIKPFEVTRNYKADNSLFKQTFQFSPSRSLEEAVLELWEHLEKHPEDALDPLNYNDKWEWHALKNHNINKN